MYCKQQASGCKQMQSKAFMENYILWTPNKFYLQINANSLTFELQLGKEW